MQTYTSEILYHMVGSSAPQDHDRNFKTLCRVLESMKLRHRKVDGLSDPIAIRIGSGASSANGEPIIQTVICFCDIHFCQLRPIHTGKYGCFGIGVDKEIVADCGGRPVIYIPTLPKRPWSLNNSLVVDTLNAYWGLRQYLDISSKDDQLRSRGLGNFPASADEAVSLIATTLGKNVLAFLKQFDVGLADDDPRNYYMEREWRMFGDLDLSVSLKKVVVGKGYGEKFKKRFPEYSEILIEISL